MNDAPAGTPTPTPDDTPKGGTPKADSDDSKQVTVSEQFKKEALESWKPAREEANLLKQQLAAEQARNEELQRLAYGGGRQATDPRVERIARLQEMAASGDVASEAVLELERDLYTTKAENWLSGQLLENEVPKGKQEAVATIVRAHGYRMSVKDALSKVSDPETLTLAERLKSLEQENERLKSARPHGISPAAVTPASADAGDSGDEPIKYEDYIAALQRGGDKAREIKSAVGSGKRKLIR